ETILLPFQVNGKKSESENEIELPKESIEINDEEMEMPVSKEVTLSGMDEDVKINGEQFDMDRIDFTQNQGETEVWEIYNEQDDRGGMFHPFYNHGTQCKVILINGEKAPRILLGYKDTISVDPGDNAKVAVKFEENGTYMFHCYILEH